MSEKKTEFTIKEDGFHGNLFECQSENNPYPKKILIICSGSDGDFENSKSYFNIPDGPSILKETPIDYIGEAANYLKSI
ncbi:hypothetical protein BCR32DRAFT_298622, partial [Anaeromyces robustus]